jgi:isocitrate lyase
MGTKRNYDMTVVEKLRGSRHYVNQFALHQAQNFRAMLRDEYYINTFGAYNGQQAVQHVKAGLKAIYCSGWQVAASANSTQEVYPDQSLYAVNSVPDVVRSINNAFKRQDQISYLECGRGFKYAPIIADAEAGFGGALNAYELTRNLIDAGAAAVHFEDQLASEKKCGHLGGKVLVPVSVAIRNLTAARLASDVAGTDTVIIARTDAESAKLLSSDIDSIDKPFIKRVAQGSGGSIQCRTKEGFYMLKEGMGLEYGCVRGQAYAEYADLVWCETSKPCLKEAKRFADAVRGAHPNQMLAYNCSPSFNWRQSIPSDQELAEFQRELAKMGFVFQFITLGGFHSTNHAVFQFAKDYKENGMLAYSRLQEAEFDAEADGYTSTRHQREVGVSYFDAISEAVGSGSTKAMADSTESDQF